MLTPNFTHEEFQLQANIVDTDVSRHFGSAVNTNNIPRNVQTFQIFSMRFNKFIGTHLHNIFN